MQFNLNCQKIDVRKDIQQYPPSPNTTTQRFKQQHKLRWYLIPIQQPRSIWVTTPITMTFKQNALYEQNVLSSHGLHRSTFGDERLNYRVRNGIGWSLSLWFRSYKAFSLYEPNIWSYQVTNFCAPWRLHSVMGKNHESKRNNQDKELDQLVLLAWNPYKSYSCSLSTS